MKYGEMNGKKYDARHGGAFDRGSADSWYSRGRDPHLYEGDTAMSPRIGMSMMSPEEIEILRNMANQMSVQSINSEEEMGKI